MKSPASHGVSVLATSMSQWRMPWRASIAAIWPIARYAHDLAIDHRHAVDVGDLVERLGRRGRSTVSLQGTAVVETDGEHLGRGVGHDHQPRSTAGLGERSALAPRRTGCADRDRGALQRIADCRR